MLHAEREISHCDFFFHPVADAVDVLIVVSGQMKHGLAHRFTRDSSRVDANAADDFSPFDQRYSLARLSALYRRPLTCRPGANHDQIVIRHWRRPSQTQAPAA